MLNISKFVHFAVDHDDDTREEDVEEVEDVDTNLRPERVLQDSYEHLRMSTPDVSRMSSRSSGVSVARNVTVSMSDAGVAAPPVSAAAAMAGACCEESFGAVVLA